MSESTLWAIFGQWNKLKFKKEAIVRRLWASFMFTELRNKKYSKQVLEVSERNWVCVWRSHNSFASRAYSLLGGGSLHSPSSIATSSMAISPSIPEPRTPSITICRDTVTGSSEEVWEEVTVVSRRLVVYSTVDIHGICYICGCHSRSQVEFLNPQMRKSPGFLSDLVSRLPDSVNLTCLLTGFLSDSFPPAAHEPADWYFHFLVNYAQNSSIYKDRESSCVSSEWNSLLLMIFMYLKRFHKSSCRQSDCALNMTCFHRFSH